MPDICRHMPAAERVKLWTAHNCPIPEGMMVGWTCAVTYCGKLEHMKLREDLTFAVRQRSQRRSYIFPHLEKLEAGKTIGVKVPDGDTAKAYAVWLNGRLASLPQFWNFTFLIRVKADDLLSVRKHGLKTGERFTALRLCSVCDKEGCKKKRRKCKPCGRWFHRRATKNKTCSPACGRALRSESARAAKPLPEEMPLCACGCGKRVTFLSNCKRTYRDGVTIKAGEPVRFCKGHRMAKMGRCLGCGKEFKLKQRKYVCSRECANVVGYGWRRLGKKPWEIRPDRWKRIKCVVCGKFKWRRKHQWRITVCSMNCRQKRSAEQHGWRKVPEDREILQSLLDRGMTCADINRHFGAHPSSAGARLTLGKLGLKRVIAPRWRTRVERPFQASAA